MKKEAPKKLYYAPYGDIRENHPITDNDIEYIRTDAFIKKACEWINDNANEYWDTEFVDSGVMAEDFKKYMKEE